MSSPPISFNLDPSHFSFGPSKAFLAADPQSLGAAEFTIVTLVVDVSQSVSAFASQLEQAIKNIVGMCHRSPRASNLMFQVILFNHTIVREDGFRELSAINLADFDGMIQPDGCTALYDAVCRGIETTFGYAETLSSKSFDVNAVLFVITDGMEYVPNGRRRVSSPDVVAGALNKARSPNREILESFQAFLVGVNIGDPDVKDALDGFQKIVQFDHKILLEDASPTTLAKLAEWVSKSVQSASQALGTGGPSQVLTF